jgi:hypothetical protein
MIGLHSRGNIYVATVKTKLNKTKQNETNQIKSNQIKSNQQTSARRSFESKHKQACAHCSTQTSQRTLLVLNPNTNNRLNLNTNKPAPIARLNLYTYSRRPLLV